jgi:hypothetical protein
VPDAVARLQRRTTSVTAAITAADATDTFGGRITDIGEAWTPQVLLVANPGPADSAALAELADTLRGTGRCAVVVATTAQTGREVSTRYIAAIAASGELQLDLPFLNTTAQAAGLPAAELQPLAEIMTLARARVDEPVPPAPEPESWADGTDAAGALLRLVDNGDAATAAPATTAPVTDEQWADSLSDLVTAAPEPSTPDGAAVDPILSTTLFDALPGNTVPNGLLDTLDLHILCAGSPIFVCSRNRTPVRSAPSPAAYAPCVRGDGCVCRHPTRGSGGTDRDDLGGRRAHRRRRRHRAGARRRQRRRTVAGAHGRDAARRGTRRRRHPGPPGRRPGPAGGERGRQAPFSDLLKCCCGDIGDDAGDVVRCPFGLG